MPQGRITELSGHSTVCEGGEARDRGQVRSRLLSLLESEFYWRAAGSPRRALGREVPGLNLMWGMDQRRKTGRRDTARKPLQNTGENRQIVLGGEKYTGQRDLEGTGAQTG